MGAEPLHSLNGSLASALEWWREAGVDMLVEDEAHDWLARAVPASLATPAPVAAPPPTETLPVTLEAFLALRIGETAPEAEWMTPRLVPTGPSDAEWMLVTDMPDPEDSDTLMRGAAGRLLDRMLAAIGLSRETVYLMPLAWARPLTGRIAPDHEAKLLDLARHQLKLLRPRKLLLLGQAASRVIGSTSHSPGGDSIEAVNHFGAKTLALATYHPRFLLERPAAKNEAWKHLLLLSRGEAE